jgi:hypothetical protein
MQKTLLLAAVLAGLVSPSYAAPADPLVSASQNLDVTLNVKQIRKDHDRMERERRQEAELISNNPEVMCLVAARKKGVPVADAVKLCGQPAKTEQAPVSCYDAARAGNVEYVEAIKLCRGNPNSDAPAKCYAKARDYNVAYVDAVCLCEAALDASPAECYFNARKSNVAYADALKLCKP